MNDRANLRARVEELLPNWRSWYPSLFHAAEDLGIIRARVCSPDSLMLSNRHSSIQNQALQAFLNQTQAIDVSRCTLRKLPMWGEQVSAN